MKGQLSTYVLYLLPGPSLLPAPLWPRDVSGYDSDDEQYRGAQLDLQRRASSGDPLRQELGKKYKLWLESERVRGREEERKRGREGGGRERGGGGRGRGRGSVCVYVCVKQR